MDTPRPPTRGRFLRPALLMGATFVIALTIGILVYRLEPAVPTMSAGSAWTDTVRRGSMVLTVRGPGLLVPERVRLVSALTAGRVERRSVAPGAAVHAGSVLLELENPDVRLDALDAVRQLSAAEAVLQDLTTSLATQRLNQLGVITTLEREAAEARRLASARRAVAAAGGVAGNDLANAEDRADELQRRTLLDQERLVILEASATAQIRNQERQVAAARDVARFQENRVASLRVRAAVPGIVQEVAVEEGQWVTPGTILARVVQPERLKAVLRIPDVQARDVVPGQRAVIDLRPDTVVGRVTRVDPAVTAGGTVAVDVEFEGPLPRGARPDLGVEGTIALTTADDVLYVRRPGAAQAGQRGTIWKVEGAEYATRVPVQFGRGSADIIEIVSGLDAGDVILLNDVAAGGGAARVRLR